MKKFTFLFALAVFISMNLFGQETVYTVPAWDGTKKIDLCDGGTFTLYIENSQSGHVYNLAQPDAEGLIQSLTGTGGTLVFDPVAPVFGTDTYSILDAMDFSPFILFTTNVVADPLPAELNMTPSSPVCQGTFVSASLNTAGSGGISCSDRYEYSTDGGTTWADYTLGTSIPTSSIPFSGGVGSVQVKSIRDQGAGLERGCYAESTYSWVVNQNPLVSDVVLQASEGTSGPPWNYSVNGNLGSGYDMCIDATVGYYYLDINTLTTSATLNSTAFSQNGFYLDGSYPQSFFDYWAAKGVVNGAGGWQGVMWNIINGTAPMFYIAYDGSDYTLVDGLQYQYTSAIAPLRVSGDYPEDTYTYKGTVESNAGCASADIYVNMTFTTIPVPTISGSDAVCSGSTETYTTEAGKSNYSWTVTGGTGSSTTNSIDITWGSAGSGQVSVNYESGNGCTAASPTVLPVSISDAPSITAVGLQFGLNLAGPWESVPGNLTGGYSMCIHPDWAYFYLDVDNFTSTPDINAEHLNPFLLSQSGLPSDWTAYWTAKGVVNGAPGWQGVMYDIITGNQPIFYLYKTTGGDYQLIDGLQYQIGQGLNPLRISGDYPLGSYTYNGTVTNGPGCNTPMTVNMEFNGGVLNVTQTLVYCTIQDAIDGASTGDVIKLGANFTEGLVTINKDITLDGGGYTLTSASATWGVQVANTGVTIQNLTVYGAGTFGIITQPESDNLQIINTTVTEGGGSGFAMNCVDNIVLTNITSTNNGGNGVSITDCNNVTINGITTSGNQFGGGFGAGIGIFSGGGYCTPGTSGVVVNEPVNIGETPAIYEQVDAGGGTITGVVLPASFTHYMGLTDPYNAKYYYTSLIDALTSADFALFTDPNLQPYTYVEEIGTGNLYVAPAATASVNMSVQAAIVAADPGETINVYAGTFTEQCHIDKEGLSIIGAGQTSTYIKSPTNLAWFFGTSNQNYPVVGVDGVASFNMSGLTVDGDGQGNSNYRFIGIAFWNAGGTLNNVDVTGIRETPLSGGQHGVGVYSYNDGTGGPYLITINGMNMGDFQKNGFALLGENLTVDLDNIIVTGSGPLGTGLPAQNGIQIGYGASGTLDDCQISDIDYTGETWAASGYILTTAVNVIATNITMTDCQVSAYIIDSDGSLNNSSISNPTGDGMYIYSSGAEKGNSPVKELPEASFIEENYKTKNPKATNVTFSLDGCTITGTAATDSWGVGPYGYDAITANITNCEITNWDYGVVAYDFGGASITCTLTHNNLENNTVGYYSNTTNEQDAEENWWGSDTGPYNDPYNTCGTGSAVEGLIDYIPWCIDAVCSGTTSGSALSVQNVNLGTFYCSIQAAIDDPNTLNGHVITVSAGTYKEMVYVNKSVELRGPNYGISGTDPGRVGEAIVCFPDNTPGWETLFYVDVVDVTIDGFTLSDNGIIPGDDVTGIYSNQAANIQVANNIVDGFTYTSILLSCGGYSASTTPLGGALVIDNYFLNNSGLYSAIYLQGQGGTVSGNTVDDCGGPIQIQPYSQPIGGTVTNNIFNGYVLGIYHNYATLGSGKWTYTNNAVAVANAPAKNPTAGKNNAGPGPEIEPFTIDQAKGIEWKGIRVRTHGTSGSGAPPEVEFSSNNTIDGSGALSDPYWDDVIGLLLTNTNGNSVVDFFDNVISNTDYGVKTEADVHNTFIDLQGNSISNYNLFAITLESENGVVATGGNTYDGVTSATATLTELFAIEDAIRHKIDESTRGLVTVIPGELYVTPNSFAGVETSPSIQRGIDAASAGWTVHVDAGTYSNQLTINKDLSVIGVGESITTILCPASGRTVVTDPYATFDFDYVLAAYATSGTIDVRIEGFTIDGNGQDATDPATQNIVGAFFRDVAGTNAGLYSCTIQNFGTYYASYPRGSSGSYILGASELAIDDCDISGYTVSGLVANGDGSTGTDPNVVFIGNIVTGPNNLAYVVGHGLQFGFGAGGTASGNTVSGHTGASGSTAMYFYSAANNSSITGNDFSDCYQGVNLHNSDNCLISGNTFTDLSLDAIHLGGDSDGNTISGNVITMSDGDANRAAIQIESNCGNNIIGGDLPADGNTITLPTTGSNLLYAIWLSGSDADGVTIKNNMVNGGKRSIQFDGPPGHNGINTIADNELNNPDFGGIMSYCQGTFVITGNTITNGVRPMEFWQAGLGDLTINGNIIDGSTFDGINVGSVASVSGGINNNQFINISGPKILNNHTAISIDATCNWWGTTDPFAIQNSVSGDVNFLPFWASPSGPCTGLGPVVNVDLGTSYMKIQDALDDPLTVNGHTITVAAGTYVENLDINKSVSILGAGIGQSIIQNTVAIDVGVSEAFTFDGFTVDWQGATYYGPSMSLTGFGNYDYLVTISNNYFDRGRVYLDHLKQDVLITNNTFDLATIGWDRHLGAMEIAYNDITAYEHGIAIFTWAWWLTTQDFDNFEDLHYIHDNTINTNDGCGILYYSVRDRRVGGVVQSTPDKAIFKNLKIENNTISNVGGGFEQGAIVLKRIIGQDATGAWHYDGVTDNTGFEDAIITGNTFTGFAGNTADGILLYGSERTVITANGISDFAQGLSLNGLIDGTQVNENTLVNNTFGLQNTSVQFADATCNWWNTTDPFVIQSLISGDVEFLPFWTSDIGPCDGQGPVVNVDQGTSFMEIQAAIDDPLTVDGDHIQISAGNFAENVVVNKRLSITGSGNTTIVQGGSGNAFTYTASGSGLDVTNRAQLYNVQIDNSVKGIYASEVVSYLELDGVTFEGITSYGIHINNVSGVMNDWIVNNCTFNSNAVGIRMGMLANLSTIDITGCDFTNNTSQGIYIAQSNSAPGGFDDVRITGCNFTENGNANNLSALYFEKLSNAQIHDNNFTDNGPAANPRAIIVNLKYDDYLDIEISENILSETRGSATNGYAMFIAGRNDGSYSSVPASLGDLAISNNEINGFYNGIGFENNVDWNSSSVANNKITNCYTALYGVGANTGLTLNVEENDFTGSILYHIANGVVGSTINANCNWFNSTDPYVIQSQIVGTVNFLPFLTDGNDNSTDPGFQPVPGSCNGLGPVVNITQGTSYMLIQPAMDAANDGDEIHASDGIYVEQVHVVTPNITLIGESMNNTIIRSPENLTYFYNTGSNDNYPVVFIDGADGFSISNLTVDGDHQGDNNFRFQGVGYWNAGGTMEDLLVINVMDNTFSGAQHGVGVYTYNNTGGPYTYLIDNVDVTDFQKNAFAINGDGITATVTNCDVVGAGSTSITAQNGIQVWAENNSSATISNCTVDGIDYTGTGWTASGILLYYVDDITLDNVYVSNSQSSFYNWDIDELDINECQVIAGISTGIYVKSLSPLKDSGNELLAQPFGESKELKTTKTGTSNVTITNCELTGNDNTVSRGIGFSANAGSTINASILNSKIWNMNYAVLAWDYGATCNLTAFENSFENTYTANFYNPFTQTWDATCNWYNTTDPAIIGSTIAGPVQFLPYLTDGTDSSADPGFQPVPGSCGGLGLVHNLTQGTSYMTIQGAIDDADPNDVLELTEYTFNEQVTIDRSLTLQGVSETNCIIDGTGFPAGRGIYIDYNVENVTITNLTVQNFAGSNGNLHAGIYAIGGNNNLTVEYVTIQDNVGGSGFYANGPIDNVSLNYVTSTGHTTGARGIVIWNGYKSNISITNCHVYNNNCCGIELQDGTASGVTMSGNNVHDNGDSGMSAVGLTSGSGPNIISNNILADNGRFGIEIKCPDGSGLNSGDGSIVLDNNTVTFTASTSMNNRDHAGIAVFRRGYLTGSGYNDVPTGVFVTNNTVSGFTQLNPSATTSEGFGIVVEGVDHTITGNIFDGNDVGLQLQGGGHPNPNYTFETTGDGDQADGASPYYFGRGNAPYMCNITAGGNTFGTTTPNGIDTRVVVEPLTPVADPGLIAGQLGKKVENTNTQITYCSFQGAIDAIYTLDGHSIDASAGTYAESVMVDKQLTISGAGPDLTFVEPIGGLDAFTVSADNVSISDLEITHPTEVIEGIQVVSGASSGLTLSNLDITNIGRLGSSNGYGVNIKTSFSGLTITDCDFIATHIGAYSRGIGVFTGNNLNHSNFEVTGSSFQYLFVGVYIRSAINGLDIDNNVFGPTEIEDCTAAVAGIYIGDGSQGNFDVENVYVTNNEFTTYGRGVYMWNYSNGDYIGTVDISGNTFTNSIWSSAIRFIAQLDPVTQVAYLEGPVTIDNNNFNQGLDVGVPIALIDFRAGGESMTSQLYVTNNEMTLTAPIASAIHGILFRGTVTNALVSGNTINGNNYSGNTGGPPTSSGVFIGTDSYLGPISASASIDVLNNYILGLDNGVVLYDQIAATYGNLPSGASLAVNNNNLAGNTYGIYSGAGEATDATCNWWGTTDPFAIASYVNGNVVVSPYLTDGTDDQPGVPGFQPIPGSCGGIQPVHNVTQNLYYSNINPAVQGAFSGDVITVEAGTYVEAGQIHIDKDLTISGAGPLLTIVNTDQNTGSSGDTRGWWLVDEGVTFHLSDMTLDGAGYLVYQGIRHKGTGTIDNVNFTNIKYNESGPNYNGVAVAAFGTTNANVDVTNCTFSEIGRVGVLYFGTGITASSFTGNVYTGKGSGDWLDYGVEVGAGAKVTIQNYNVSNNLGVASSDGSTSAGMLITEYFGPGSEATVTMSTFTGNTTGIAVGYDEFDNSTVVAHNNSFTGNDFGITSEASIVDAADNWWGDATGPYHDPHNTCGLGDEITDYVDFYEWWADAGMTTRYAYPMPAITSCPVNVTLAQYEDRDPYATGYAVADDGSNCYKPVVITYSDDRSGLTGCNVTGDIIRTFTATDYLGHTSTCIQTITIEDVSDPVVVCPTDITVDNDPGQCSAVVTYDPTASDFGFFQGFEHTDWVVGPDNLPSTDWNTYYSNMYRAPSGTDGIVSKTGSAHAVIDTNNGTLPWSGVFSRIGGYYNSFGEGFVVEQDVYFNLSDPGVSANTYGWDISCAASTQTGGHLRDFIFHTAGEPGKILVAGSNNTNFTRRNDLATLNHYEVVVTGWYTLQWVFRDFGDGSLAVDLNLLDGSGNLLWTETRNNGGDLISTVVGGNRYLWFTFLEVEKLAVDNTSLERTLEVTSTPVSGTAFAVGTTQVTAEATDACGNGPASCIFNVTVEDNELPNAVCQNITIYLDNLGEVDIVATDVDGGSTDNCGIDTYGVDKDHFTCADLGDNTVTLTVTDIHGNSNTCSATVTVVDNIPPTVSCPGNQDRCADETVADSYTAVGTEFDYTAADDNCTIDHVDYVLSGATSGTGTGTLDGVVFNTGITTVSWTAVDQSTNSSVPCSFTVTVTASPDPNIVGNTIVVGGSTEVYQTTYVSTNVYNWTAVGGTVIVNPSPNDYICEVIWDASNPAPMVIVEELNTVTGCSFIDTLLITINPVELQGTVKYHNNSGTPMNNVTVRLKTGALVVASTTTDATGYFQFNSVAGGSYTLEVETSKAWGGANSTDALAIQRTAIAPVSPFPWWLPDAFIDNVGDVNESGNLSSLDALLVKQRTVHLINSFPAGEWAFWKDDGDNINGINFTNTGPYVAYMNYSHTGPTTLDIRAMCYGDVNGSFLPSFTKSTMLVENDGVINVLGDKDFELPVRLTGYNEHEIGAMSIFLSYADHLINVKALESNIPGLIYKLGEGFINVAWSDLQSLSLPSDGTIFTLTVSPSSYLTGYDDLFMYTNETQFADMNCNILNDVYLNIKKVSTEFKSDTDLSEFYSLECYPNPVKYTLNIAYTIPESGQVKISIVNSLGAHVADIMDETKDAGNYILKLEPADYGLETGVYYCRMLVEGDSSSHNEMVRFVYKR